MTDTKTEPNRGMLRPRAGVASRGDGKILCVLEMPGVVKEDLEIKIENNKLTVIGRRPSLQEYKYLLRERRVGDYLQTFTLDETVDQTKVDATLEKGILTVTLELKEHVKPRTIKVRSE
jgi:HSP20 family protein